MPSCPTAIISFNDSYAFSVLEADYAEFCKRIRLYKETGAVVKLTVESTGNTKHFKNQMEKAGTEVTVVNTVKFKVINESVSKTNKHDAATLSEFLKDYKLPESYLCSKETENMTHNQSHFSYTFEIVFHKILLINQ